MLVMMYTVFVVALSYTSYVYYFPEKIDKRLLHMSQQYVIDAAKYNIEVDLNDLRYIGVADLPDGLAGFGLTPHVLLRGDYILDQEILYHELTHSLGKCFGHLESDGLSIMGATGYAVHLQWDEAVKKLFTKDIYKMNCNFKGMNR